MPTQSASAQPARSPNTLTIYLNDHLAGSTAALDLLAHLQQSHCSTPIGQFAAELKKEVFEDRQKLQLLMVELNIKENRVRQAGTWFMDQLFKWKTELDDRDGGALGLLEALEAVAIGIDGKIALWTALGEAAKGTPELAKLDYGALKERAREQRERIEGMRLSAAVDALRFPPARIAPIPGPSPNPAPVSNPAPAGPPPVDVSPTETRPVHTTPIITPPPDTRPPETSPVDTLPDETQVVDTATARARQPRPMPPDPRPLDTASPNIPGEDAAPPDLTPDE